MPKFLTLFSLAAGLILMSLPARADSDWIYKSFSTDNAEARSSAKQTRKQYRSEISEAKSFTRKVVRSASTDDDDEDIRPQRHAAFKPRPRTSVTGEGQSGIASYYWEPQALASGGRFNPNAMTAAHKTLPFGTRVRVTRVDNGNSVEVVINDRGPYVGGRIIDLSRRAAQELSMTGAGVARVRVAILGR